MSALKKYVDFFVGRPGLWPLFGYELANWFVLPAPGAVGYALRKMLVPRLLGVRGKGVFWGRNVIVRHGHKMDIGDGTGFDDGCLLDARGTDDGGYRIGRDVIVARGVGLQSKASFIEIGDECVFGYGALLSSAGGIRLGSNVMVSGGCYIGGGRYPTDDLSTPMRQLKSYSKGPVEIGDDVWIGAGATILDGAKVGSGTVIGAGAVIQQDLPEKTIVSPYSKLVQLPRG